MELIMKPNRNEKIALMKTKDTGVQIEMNPRHEWRAEWNARKKCWVLKRDVFQVVMTNKELVDHFHPFYKEGDE